MLGCEHKTVYKCGTNESQVIIARHTIIFTIQRTIKRKSRTLKTLWLTAEEISKVSI